MSFRTRFTTSNFGQAMEYRPYNVTPNAKRRLALKIEFVRLSAKQFQDRWTNIAFEPAQRWECGRQLIYLKGRGAV